MHNMTEALMDAVLIDSLDFVDPAILLPHVLSQPVDCPGWCGRQYALLTSEDNVIEIEMGLECQEHVNCLMDHLSKVCREGSCPSHIRTDGIRVWSMTQ